MSNIQTDADRMPHDLSHLGFLAGEIGRLITISTTPVIAGDSFEVVAVGALRLSPLRRGLALDSRSSYFATFRHQLTILSKTDALDEEKWLNMLGTFVKDWFRYESHFVHGRDSLVDILKERGLLSESDAVQPLIGKKS